MKLYSAVERIYNDLESLGYSREDALDPRVLAGLDQLHYHGTEAVDAAAQALGIVEEFQVLDIGSGFGGPARWLASQHGATVKAVELQGDMNGTAADLTRRCGLSDKVMHIQGDILKTPLESEGYDAAVSWLALYHIPNRSVLFPNVFNALKSGGGLYIEDLYQISTPTPVEQQHLDGMLAAGTMHTRDVYLHELTSAGFTDIDFHDKTEDWVTFTTDRVAAFKANKDAYIAHQSVETYAELEEFYDVVADVLAGGNVGGVRLTAWKR
ncbi:MAG: methyltransferase domain-containing protein [Pseudomonadota bacterium]